MLSLCFVNIKQQHAINHSFMANCQKTKQFIELCSSSTQKSKSAITRSDCQRLIPASHRQICQEISEHLLDKSVLPYEKTLSLPSEYTNIVPRTSINLTYQENTYTTTILKLFTRLIILKLLIYCIIHVPIPQVMSILMIGFAICTELILSFV